MAWPTQLSLVREVPYMGVIRVLEDAAEFGYRADHPDWRNLGQGQPEVGPLPGAPDRVGAVQVEPHDHAYGPVAGVHALRQAVAEYYNATYRTSRASQYTADNVAITPGGRAGLARVFTALEPHTVGCFSPDYPAYVDLFRFLGVATARSVDLTAETGFALSALEHLLAALVTYGINWTNMMQPFWALPMLALAGLQARHIVGYTLLVGLWEGVVVIAALLLLPLLF